MEGWLIKIKTGTTMLVMYVSFFVELTTIHVACPLLIL